MTWNDEVLAELKDALEKNDQDGRLAAGMLAGRVIKLRDELKDRDRRIEALSLELEFAETTYVATAMLVPTEEDGR